MSVKPMSVKPMSVEIAAFSDRHDQIRCSRSGVCIGLALFLGAVSMSALSAEIWATEKNGSVATGSFWDEGVLPGDSDEGTLKNSIGTLGAGESFSGQNFTVGREGTATNAVSGGTMTLSGELAVGKWGSGWMEVSDGSVSVRKLNLGLFGSVGYMDVSGGTVSVSGDNFCVGGYGGGYGWLTLRDGGAITVADGNEFRVFGEGEDSVGIFDMTGGTLDVAKISVGGTSGGNRGKGTWNFSGGAVTVSGSSDVEIGRSNNNEGFNEGFVNQTGGTLDFSGHNVFVGHDGGVGHYRITGGSLVQTPQEGSSKEFAVGGLRGNNPTRGYMEISGSGTNVRLDWMMVGGIDSSWWSKGATGVVNQASGRVEAERLYLGAAIGEASGDYTVSGGTLKVNGDFHIGHQRTASGRMTIKGGAVTHSSGNLTIGHEGDGDGMGTGELIVDSGSLVNENGDIRIGEKGKGTFTMNGGDVSAKWWLKLANDSANANVCTFNFNGGVLKVAKISKGEENNVEGNKRFNWNGGTFRPNNGDNTPLDGGESFRMDIDIMAGGAVVDTTDCNNTTFSHDLRGVGGLTKRGGGTLTLTGAIDLKRGFVVEQGSVVVESGKIETVSSEEAPVKQIVVAADASLDLGGAELWVQRYSVDGVDQEAGTYSAHNGTIHVIADSAPAASTWTNAMGDGDVTNGRNWESKNAAGATLYDVVPTAETVVAIPYGETLDIPDGFACAQTVLSVSGTVKLDAGNAAPEVAKTAIAWYDAADESTVAVVGAQLVSAIANKGTAGEKLDLELYHSDGTYRRACYDYETLNGRKLVCFTNSYGFVSKCGAGIGGDQDRTLVAVAKVFSDTFPNFDSEGNPKYNSEGTEYDWRNNIYSIGLEEGNTSVGAFNIEDIGWRHNFFYRDWRSDKEVTPLNSDSAADYDWGRPWAIWSMVSNDRTVSGAFKDINGTVKTSESAVSLALCTSSERGKIMFGQRARGDEPSVGAIAEAFVFDRALSSTEMDALRDYLSAKWFTAPDYSSLPNAVSLESGAELDLSGVNVTFAKVYGGGTLSNGAATITDALVITVNDDGTIDPLAVDGALVIGANARLVVKNARKLVGTNPVVALSATEGITGSFASAVSDPEGLPLRSVKSADGKSITIARRGGLMLIVR